MEQTHRAKLWILAGAASFVSAAASAYGHQFVVASFAVVAGALAVVNAIGAHRAARAASTSRPGPGRG